MTQSLRPNKIACLLLKRDPEPGSSAILLIPRREKRGAISLALNSEQIQWRCEDGVIEEPLLPTQIYQNVLNQIYKEGVYVFEMYDLLIHGHDSEPIAHLHLR